MPLLRLMHTLTVSAKMSALFPSQSVSTRSREDCELSTTMNFELNTCFVGCSLLRIGLYGDVCPMCAVPTLPPHSGNVKSSARLLP